MKHTSISFNQHGEPILLIHNTHAYIITIQEIKLTSKANTPKVHHFTTVRTDRSHNERGGLITLIRDNITFTTKTYRLPLIHTTQNFKCPRHTLTTLNISQWQTCIYLLDTAHPRTTKQLTRTYNTAYSTSQTYDTQNIWKEHLNAHWNHRHCETSNHHFIYVHCLYMLD